MTFAPNSPKRALSSWHSHSTGERNGPLKKKGKEPQNSAHSSLLSLPPSPLSPSCTLNSCILNHSYPVSSKHLTRRLLIYSPVFPSPPPPEQPPSSEDPADAWFNAAGILLSLKHAAAERSARMGAPMEMVQWTPPGSDPSITQQQVCNLFARGWVKSNHLF